MLIEEIFHATSDGLLSKFKKSSYLDHSVSKGTLRENALKVFLLESGRLPIKYGLVSGHVINPLGSKSKQCDIILYNKFDGITFMGENSADIVPVESVYGVIEVKSSLTRGTLIDGLDNIKSVKAVGYSESMIISPAPGMSACVSRPQPFGVVFAYSLSNNSISSLLQNVKDWQNNNELKYWPDMVVILNEGIIFNTKINEQFQTVAVEHKNNTLFYFYYYFLELCNVRPLTVVPILKYINPNN